MNVWSPTSLPGVLRTRLTIHGDARGSFSELFRASGVPAGVGPFVQVNLSRSARGVLRGMHFHGRQSDLWIVVEGRAFVGLVDLRIAGTDGGQASLASPPMTEPPTRLTEELEPGEALLIPPLVAHGFYAVEDLALLYLVTNEYDGTDELGFAWDDPAARIDWPTREPILSGRDRSNPAFAEALENARAAGRPPDTPVAEAQVTRER